MADIVGTASAITGLIGQAITLVQQIQGAWARIRANPKTIKDLSIRLGSIGGTLRLVQQEPRLHDTAVEQSVKAIVDIYNELKVFFNRLEDRQKKSAAQQFVKGLKDGAQDDVNLGEIMGRLADARGELIVRISAVHVGLTGNLNDGFKVARDIVMEINDNVSQVLGTQLVLAKWLQHRQLTTNASGIIELDDSDIDALGLRGQEVEQQSNESENLKWHRNKTGDDAGIVAGNLGFEASEQLKLAPVRATVEDNEFGKNLRFVAGHVKTSEDFFKRLN
ncbi:hypothetical protein B0J13DRAFT_677127 [Dactylonectria estremocensis]|uniref:Fungal N-terminal domain-containing protein n=1 Tax=Dactylonectria estremocensis TaxID=1079267 RepID=A0A9P9EMX0_9HYPO|nr:hypothetical protein B0J13DRAFT_677127 [Dactylonectria estremocensis]